MHAIWPIHHIILHAFNLVRFGKLYKSCISCLISFIELPVTYSILDQNINICTLFSSTLSYTLNERDKVSHSYKIRQNYSQCLCCYTDDGKKKDSELKGTRDLRYVIF